jgi:type I restriction enzyme, S subunit
MKSGWEVKKLGDLCHVIGGGTPSKDNSEFYSGDIPWATVRDMRSEVITETECMITNEAVRRSATNIIPGGNVVIATRVGLGKVCLLGQDTAVNQDLRGIVPKNPKDLSVRFLFWWFRNNADLIVAEGTGATVQGVKLPFVKSLKILHPPFPEQQRIVGILDEAFEGIAIAKANAEKNLRNARNLFESYLQSVFTQRGEGWVEKKLINLTTKIGSGATPRGGESSYKTEGISLIRSLNVHDLGFKYLNLAFLDDSQADGLSNVIVQECDVLLNITGASVARCCIVPDEILPARVNQHVSIIRPITSEIDASFLHYLLISKYYKEKLLRTGAEGGSTRQAITKAQIQEFSVLYPSKISEQKSIVSKLDSILIETQRLESIYQRKIAALDALKKSLLHQAFSGQL